MDTERLAQKINDAADGLLSPAQLARLETELGAYPDLLQDYHEIMELPDMSGLYGPRNAYRDTAAASKIRRLLSRDISEISFPELTVSWFKKYALAACLLILALASVFYIGPYGSMTEETSVVEELLYPAEDTGTDAYVYYLDEWMEQ